MNWQQPIPRNYTQLPLADITDRIAARKTQLADKLIILGHHYQQDNVIRFADVVGDSYQLSRDAAKLTHAQYVIFCGVHFMAESADILTSDSQHVILPDLGAGCSMADMAQLEDVEDARAVMEEACRDLEGFKLVPITYMNSSAAIKAFVGEHGGAVCTSSNCEKILRWGCWTIAHCPLPIANQKKRRHPQSIGNRQSAIGNPTSKSSSSPTSTSAATPRTKWVIRSIRCRCGITSKLMAD